MFLRKILSFPDFWKAFDEATAQADPKALAAADHFFDQLPWWAPALQEATVRSTS